MPGAPWLRQKPRKRKWRAQMEKSVPEKKMTSSNDALSFLVGLTSDSGMESNIEDVIDTDNSAADVKDIQFPCASTTTTSNSDNLVYFGGDEFLFDAKDLERQKKVARQLEQLQFSNPGEHNKLPTKRGRPKRGAEKKNKPGAYHNKQGKLLLPDQSVFICDCLDADCGGCHSPCKDCKGRYCGPICQSNRPRYCAKVTTLGKAPIYNPYFAPKP